MWAAGLGAIVGAAVLVKSTAIFLLVAVPLVWLVRHRRDAIQGVLVFGGAAMAVCGWYFSRNLLLYGDLTAQKVLLNLHYGNTHGPLRFTSIRGGAHWLYASWLEHWSADLYYRAIVRTPRILKAATVAFGVAAATGWTMRARSRGATSDGWHRRGPGGDTTKVCSIAYAVCFAVWLVVSVTSTNFAVRTTFPVLVVPALAVSGGVVILGQRVHARYGAWLSCGLLIATLTTANILALVGLASHGLPAVFRIPLA